MCFRLLSKLQVVDFSNGEWRYRELTPGKYLVEEVDNPIGLPDSWLVLKGTKMGINKKTWERKSQISCRSKKARLIASIAV